MTDGPKTMTAHEVSGLVVDDEVVMTIDTSGTDHLDVERTHPAGSKARVASMRRLPAPQGLSIALAIGEDHETAIVNHFDEADDPAFPFRLASDEAPTMTVEPLMESAGAELMELSFRLAAFPEFAGDVDRLRQIAAWASIDRMSDFEKGSIQVMGAMVGVMHRRNFRFHEDRPISTQFAELMDQIPDPLPEEKGYVDQKTLDPTLRRDVYDAVVTMGEVRRWTAGDGVPRSLAAECSIAPDGVRGKATIHADGFLSDLMSSNTTVTLRLRATGGAISVVGAGDMDRPIATKPTLPDSRRAASLLRTGPYDQETAAIIARGIDLALADEELSGQYEPTSVISADFIREALEKIAR
jgi:hypothetical protein